MSDNELLPVDFNPEDLYSPDSKHWEPDYQGTKEWMAQSSTPLFATAAPALMDRDPQPTSLLKYYKMGLQATYGKNYRWFPRMQWDGTCVGQGGWLCADIVVAINSLLSGSKHPGSPCVAGTYAGSRVDVAKKPGRWEGSNGNWVSRWLTSRGGILLGKELDLPDGVLTQDQWLARNKKDEQIAMRWTASREGVPTDMEKLAKERPIEGTSLVNSVQEVRSSISNLQPLLICTSLIPTGQRDEKGRSRMRRKGGHCTVIAETLRDGTGWYYTYVQSWWHWAKGPCHLDGDPFMADFKTAVCLITESEMQSVLSSRDCYTFWGVQGLEPVQDTYRI